MQVHMLTTKRGSPDGLEIRQYEAGRKYDLPERLAQIFLRAGWAEEDKELVLETEAEVTLSVKPKPGPIESGAIQADRMRKGEKVRRK